jgi:hypothetical protein
MFESKFLQVEVDIVLELLDKKARCFLVSIVFNRLFPEHSRKLVGEISVSI